MFEEAVRRKLRFLTAVGTLSTEDLFDLPLESKTKVNLDDIAQGLDEELSKSGKKSFVKKQSRTDHVLELKFGIVKYIIGVKLEEAEAVKGAKDLKEKRAVILEAIEKKKTEELGDKSVKQLEAELARLG